MEDDVPADAGGDDVHGLEVLPQLRYPLREALLSLNDSVHGLPSVRTACAESAQLASPGPYKVGSTEKSRALKKLGRLKRRGEHLGRGYAEERPLLTPRPPADEERPKSVPKTVPSAVSRQRLEMQLGCLMIRSTQHTAVETWELHASQSAPELTGSSWMCRSSVGSPRPHVRSTWTSAARAALGHGRRHATRPRGEGATGGGDAYEAPPAGLSRDSSWCAASLATFPNLPKTVREWAGSGLEFADCGLGIGSRENPEVKNLVQRSPGFNYDVNGPMRVCFTTETIADQFLSNPTQKCVALGQLDPALTSQGCHLLRWIRQRFSYLELPMLVVSSDPSLGAMAEAVRAGCNDWMAKPLPHQELLARARMAMTASEEAERLEVKTSERRLSSSAVLRQLSQRGGDSPRSLARVEDVRRGRACHGSTEVGQSPSSPVCRRPCQTGVMMTK
eukprot:g30551.t1